MPKYQYRCDDCSNEFEQFQKFSEDALTVCPTCEGFIRRVIGPVGVVFKGSGWYINDSRPSTESSSKAPADTAKKDDAAPAAKSETPSEATTKPAASTETVKKEPAKPAATAAAS